MMLRRYVRWKKSPPPLDTKIMIIFYGACPIHDEEAPEAVVDVLQMCALNKITTTTIQPS